MAQFTGFLGLLNSAVCGTL